MRNISVARNAYVEQSDRVSVVDGDADPTDPNDPTDAADGTDPVDAADPAPYRKTLLEEMAAWSSRDRGGAFKTWHRHALSLVHLNVLTALEADGPLSMTQLAQVMDISDAGATGIIDRMEKRGLVERRHDTEDRRRVVVHSTPAGIEMFGTMAEHRREMLAKMLDELDVHELHHLLTGFRALAAARARVVAKQAAAANASAGDPAP